MIQENSSNRQENIVAGDNSQLQFLSAVEEFKRAETDEEKAVAIEAMRIVANTGNKSAQYHMAAIYGNGDGVLMDLEEAVKWCRLAAEQGHMEAINPDGKLGETFNRDTWVSILNAVSYPIQEDWRNWSGAVLADPYFESIGKYTIMPDLPYSESVKDDELKVKWEQCAKSIKNNSWLAIYAKADGEFNMHIRNMITQCNNYGYADCLEWSKGEAATKWRLTQELNAVGQE